MSTTLSVPVTSNTVTVTPPTATIVHPAVNAYTVTAPAPSGSDDFASLAALLAALPSGSTMYFRANAAPYLLSAPLVPGAKRIRFLGEFAELMDVASGPAGAVLKASGAMASVLDLSDSPGSRVQSLAVHGNSLAVTGIKLGGYRTKAVDVMVFMPTTNGIWLSNGAGAASTYSDQQIVDSAIDMNGLAGSIGVLISGGSGAVGDVKIVNADIFGAIAAGIKNVGAAGTDLWVDGATHITMRTGGTGPCIDMTGAGAFRFEGVIFDGSPGIAELRVASNGIDPTVVSGCFFLGKSTQAGGIPCIDATPNTGSLLNITGNVVKVEAGGGAFSHFAKYGETPANGVLANNGGTGCTLISDAAGSRGGWVKEDNRFSGPIPTDHWEYGGVT